jgi:hypothetical protein
MFLHFLKNLCCNCVWRPYSAVLFLLLSLSFSTESDVTKVLAARGFPDAVDLLLLASQLLLVVKLLLASLLKMNPGILLLISSMLLLDVLLLPFPLMS